MSSQPYTDTSTTLFDDQAAGHAAMTHPMVDSLTMHDVPDKVRLDLLGWNIKFAGQFMKLDTTGA